MSGKVVRPVDAQVGARIRMRRLELNMTQDKLGAALGVTFQQLQKYEKGTNRVSASRLHQLSEVLQVPVDYFFSESPVHVDAQGRSDGQMAASLDAVLADRLVIRLVRAFLQVESVDDRRTVIKLVQALGRKQGVIQGSDDDDEEMTAR